MSLVLDIAAVARIKADGLDRVTVLVSVAGRQVSADLNAKSVRKAKGTVAEHGAENLDCTLQGKLLPGDVLGEAGLAVMPKTPPSRPPAKEHA